ncbi:MAG: transporter, partial [Nevskia sp.]|nr:transporter [Nevskia sp.]
GGFVWQSARSNGFTPGLTYHINQRLGLRVHKHFEPFIGVDSEYTRASDGAPRAWAVDGSIGMVFHTFANQSITLRYSATLDAESHSDNRSFNLKYAYVW